MSEKEDSSKGFKVTDRRAFTAEGELRKDSGMPPEVEERKAEMPKEAGGKSPAAPAPSEQERASSRTAPPPPPEIGFLDLVNMLVTNALMQLGDMPDPLSGERVENLEGVQVMIAFLVMLQEKTKGNLNREEVKVLDDVIYDLRMRFMTKANVIKR